MAEKFSSKELLDDSYESEQTSEHKTEKHEVDHKAHEEQQKAQLEASRSKAEAHSTPANLLAIEKDKPASGHDIATHNAIKKDSYKSLLKHTQRQLPFVSKQFSKIIHQKHIENISNIGSQTVARPSGLLGGGLGALIGSITLLYYAKHYGFEYNYAFFFITFLAGFGLGLLVELLIKFVKK